MAIDMTDVYEERIFDARARFTPGAPASRYQVGWMEALNYVLVGELPEGTYLGQIPEHMQAIVDLLDRLAGLYKEGRQFSEMGRVKGLRVTIQRMAADQGYEISG